MGPRRHDRRQPRRLARRRRLAGTPGQTRLGVRLAAKIVGGVLLGDKIRQVASGGLEILGSRHRHRLDTPQSFVRSKKGTLREREVRNPPRHLDQPSRTLATFKETDEKTEEAQARRQPRPLTSRPGLRVSARERRTRIGLLEICSAGWQRRAAGPDAEAPAPRRARNEDRRDRPTDPSATVSDSAIGQRWVGASARARRGARGSAAADRCPATATASGTIGFPPVEGA